MDNGNGNNNNYYKYETPYYETPELIDPNNNEKYKSITNISQLSNHYIKQPKPNEFIIKYDSDFWVLVFLFLIGSGFFFILIWILIYGDSENKSYIGIILCMGIVGTIACICLCGILTYKIRQKIILTEDYIQKKTYYLLCCLNKNETYNYKNIKNFQVDIQTKKNSEGDETKSNYIVFLDVYNNENYFFGHNFNLEEAEYFIYVVNNFINNRKKNKIAMSNL